VARQYRAAACGVMFCSRLVLAVFMFAIPKITQAEQQIYPETSGKSSGRNFVPEA